MSGEGLRRFGVKLRRRPLAALAGLVTDYLTYVGMVAFWLLLWAGRRPVAWLEARLHRPLRARIVEWVARVSHG
jgi:hypothetical protein